jgi:hypothetical protein
MTIRYFVHGANIAAVEDDTQASRYEAAGWTPVTREEFIEEWKKRDAREVGARDVQRMTWKERLEKGV